MIDTEVKIQLPEKEDLSGLEEFWQHAGTEPKGMKTLRKEIKHYVQSMRFAEKHWSNALVAANFINKVPAPRVTGLQRAAQQFYKELPVPLLRQHCALFSLDYDAFHTVEEAVAALIEKHTDDWA